MINKCDKCDEHDIIEYRCDKITITPSKPIVITLRWISVSERLPEEGVRVLAFDGKNYFVAMRWKTEEQEFFQSTICSCCNSEIEDPVYWIPLPEDPNE